MSSRDVKGPSDSEEAGLAQSLTSSSTKQRIAALVTLRHWLDNDGQKNCPKA